MPRLEVKSHFNLWGLTLGIVNDWLLACGLAAAPLALGKAPPAAGRPLWERLEASDVPAGKFKELDVRKARKCTRFVGAGAPGSYTELYRTAAKELANCGRYTPEDTVCCAHYNLPH
jgi:hypothetical protein